MNKIRATTTEHKAAHITTAQHTYEQKSLVHHLAT